MIPKAKEKWNNISHPYHAWLHFGIVVSVCLILKQPIIGAMLASFIWGGAYEILWDCWLVRYFNRLFFGKDEINGFSDYDIIFNCFGMTLASIIMYLAGWMIW